MEGYSEILKGAPEIQWDAKLGSWDDWSLAIPRVHGTITVKLTDRDVMRWCAFLGIRRRVPSMNNYWQRLYAASAG